MINDQNFHHYLKCLVKIAEDKPLSYEEIPKEFIDYFSLPGISQCINISINNIPEIDMDKVENYIKNNTFSNFDELATSIRDTFDSIYDKLYASFYYLSQNFEYDEERKLMKKKEPLSIQIMFERKKGVCADYSDFFRQLAKRAGITSKMIRILPFINASKGSGWNSFNPVSDPDFDHECNYIEINNQSFLSEPTWSSGKSDDGHKPYFLIPYYKGILDHFPEEIKNESLNSHFTWEQFTTHNQPNLARELCFESNPFQKITVENGFYDLQFSFNQPLDSIFGSIHLRKDNGWSKMKRRYLSFNCLGKDLPRHSFSLSNQLRCRYNLTISFPEKGEYKVTTYVNGTSIFTVYFNVEGSTDKLMGIHGYNKEKFGFIPIVPTLGLTEINNGFARIRFTVKLSRSPLLIKLYSIEKDTLNQTDKNEEQKEGCCSYFTTNLPFNYENKEEDYLVEDWVLVNFPNDGRWKVKIYFKKEGNNYTHGVTYFFDVTGTKDNNNNVFPLFDLPNNREFVPFKTKIPDKVWIEPSTETVIQEDDSFYIKVFSEFKVSLNFKKFGTNITKHPTLISETDTGDGNIKIWEYSAPDLENGHYILNLFDNNNEYINSQTYFITDQKLKKESHEEKKLMKELKD